MAYPEKRFLASLCFLFLCLVNERRLIAILHFTWHHRSCLESDPQLQHLMGRNLFFSSNLTSPHGLVRETFSELSNFKRFREASEGHKKNVKIPNFGSRASTQNSAEMLENCFLPLEHTKRNLTKKKRFRDGKANRNLDGELFNRKCFTKLNGENEVL